MSRKVRTQLDTGKILVCGECYYEREGTALLLEEEGYHVIRGNTGTASGEYILMVVALSAVPLSSLGKHIEQLYALRRRVRGNIVILLSEPLQALRLLQRVGKVLCGRTGIQHLREQLCSLVSTGSFPVEAPLWFTDRQLEELSRLRTAGRQCRCLSPENVTGYWHRSQLVRVVGVDNLQVLFASGLDRIIAEQIYRRV
ncbi:hypothetical protein [Escherichia coli]|uniref:hypothetical protein n=1 Tax=Escherichia coli TaxID=562 RepID=UPI0005A5DB46|nr:hypothetical protein [Escherichia coli]HAZ3798560.1 hypothetical protein [Escherichia coli]HBA8976434.1 hypothetical protein [Escherichia coli]